MTPTQHYLKYDMEWPAKFYSWLGDHDLAWSYHNTRTAEWLIRLYHRFNDDYTHETCLMSYYTVMTIKERLSPSDLELMEIVLQFTQGKVSMTDYHEAWRVRGYQYYELIRFSHGDTTAITKGRKFWDHAAANLIRKTFPIAMFNLPVLPPLPLIPLLPPQYPDEVEDKKDYLLIQNHKDVKHITKCHCTFTEAKVESEKLAIKYFKRLATDDLQGKGVTREIWLVLRISQSRRCEYRFTN